MAGLSTAGRTGGRRGAPGPCPGRGRSGGSLSGGLFPTCERRGAPALRCRGAHRGPGARPARAPAPRPPHALLLRCPRAGLRPPGVHGPQRGPAALLGPAVGARLLLQHALPSLENARATLPRWALGTPCPVPQLGGPAAPALGTRFPRYGPAGTRSAVRGAELRAELPPAPQGQYRARGFLPTQGDWTTRLRGSCVRRPPCWSPSEWEAEGRAPAGPQVSGLAGLSALRMGVYFRRMLGQIPENLPSACCLHEAQTIYLYKCFY